ncbi:MAG: DUF3105 domain-containing protein [Deltaproteobacteria bacterium]|nr:DUF3105 domain-containing protein [Deltaproteobacteria bacterium]
MRALTCIIGLASCTYEHPSPTGPCDALIESVDPGASAPHVPAGTEIEWSSNPPSSGAHFPEWAKWGGPYVDPVLPRGYWVHNLEHGGVAILLKCQAPCTELTQKVMALVERLPNDSACSGSPVVRRLVIARDPILPVDVQVAAAAWGETYTARCFDEETLLGFVSSRFGKAPEDTCAEGSVPRI